MKLILHCLPLPTRLVTLKNNVTFTLCIPIIIAVMMMMIITPIIIPVDSFVVVILKNKQLIKVVPTLQHQQQQQQQQQQQRRYQSRTPNLYMSEMSSDDSNINNNVNDNNQQRRNVIKSSLFAITTSLLFTTTSTILPAIANANIDTTATTTIEMKSFIDPLGLFTIQVPSRFYTVRRTAKGDLPDEITGKGRRGSSIFTAGDMAKAEIIAIERYPTRVLFEENGIDTTGTDLSTFPLMGKGEVIANLIVLRRERETKQGVGSTLTKIVPNSVKVSENGKELLFQLSTNISVQKPDLLLEQTGLSELIRITDVKATLTSNDGNILILFASALQNDYYNSVDGTALQQSISTFTALDRSLTKVI